MLAALTFGAASGHVTAETSTDGTATEGGLGGADLWSHVSGLISKGFGFVEAYRTAADSK